MRRRKFHRRFEPTGTSLWVPDGLRSVRGVETCRELETLHLPAAVRLEPVTSLPRLRELHLRGRCERPVRLDPLARAPALEELHVHDGARVRDLGALAALRTLRVVELSYVESPDLRPLSGLPLRRLVLDGVRRVRLRELEGLAVEELDLWGCELDTLEPLATMPNLREVWVSGNPVEPTLALLRHLGAGARIVLDERFDPEREADDLARLEGRGVRVFAAQDPSDHGVFPSWWGPGSSPPPEEERCPIRYATAPFKAP